MYINDTVEYKVEFTMFGGYKLLHEVYVQRKLLYIYILTFMLVTLKIYLQ